MIFDLDENPGIWFDFPGGGRVRIMNPSTAEMLEIRKACIENRPFLDKSDPDKPMVYNHEVMDNAKHYQLFYDKAIVEWEGFFDKNENPIPCDLKKKMVLLQTKSTGFQKFVDEALKSLEKASQQRADDEKKT